MFLCKLEVERERGDGSFHYLCNVAEGAHIFSVLASS